MHQGGDHALTRPTAAAADGLPPMPWRLSAEGPVLVTVHRIPLAVARASVPHGVRVLCPLPGHTLGGLFFVRYGPGSDLEYQELIVAGATVLDGWRPVPWITHLFVDSPESVRGGRTLLEAPKHLATFSRREVGSLTRIDVSWADGPIVSVEFGPGLSLWRQGVTLDAAHHAVGAGGPTAAHRVHGNQLRGRWGVARARLEVPPGSPLVPLGIAPAARAHPDRRFGVTLDSARLTLGGARRSTRIAQST
jgi:acetoacetate decarboxylase